MVFRSLEYVAKMYLYMARNREWRDPGGKFPPVLSFVLYSGSAPWRTPASIAEKAPASSAQVARMQTAHVCGVLDAVFSQIVEATEALRQEGHRQGRMEERVELAVRLAAKKFGTETAVQLRDILTSAVPEQVAVAAEMLLECHTSEEFLARVSGDNAA